MLGPLLLFGIGLGKLNLRFSIPLFAIWITFAGISTLSNARVWSSEVSMANVWFVEHPLSVRAIQLKARTLAQKGHTRLAIAVLEQGNNKLPNRVEQIGKAHV